MKNENEKIMEEGISDAIIEKSDDMQFAEENIFAQTDIPEKAGLEPESVQESGTDAAATENSESHPADKKRKSRKKSSDTEKQAEEAKPQADETIADDGITEGIADSAEAPAKRQTADEKKKHAEYLGTIRNIEKAVDSAYPSVDNGRIVSANGSLEIESYGQKVKEIKATLVDSFRNRHILRGTISGIISSPESSLIYAELYYEGIKVIFPMNEIIDVDELAEKHDPKSFALSLMQNRQGSEIDFIVAGCDGVNIAGKRREAMKQQRYRYYLRSDRNSDTESYRIEVGKTVECRVVSVTRLNIILEIHGVEIWEPVPDLSWGYIYDARENYYPGMMLAAKVMSLDTTDKDNISITVSVKILLPNMQLKMAKSMKENSSYCGTVTYWDELGHVYVKLNNGADCRCNCFDNMPKPRRGTRVIVLVKHILIKNGVALVFGVVTRSYSARR